MPMPLPVVPADKSPRLTPTDVTQFVRLEQCERFLRFKLAERSGQKFMSAYDVAPERIPPIMSLSGNDFEARLMADLKTRYQCINYAELAKNDDNRPDNARELAATVNAMSPGEVRVFFQTRLDVHLAGWNLRGDVDVIRIEKSPTGEVLILIVDAKSTTKVKIEHRLQVAFYRLMLEAALQIHAVAHAEIGLGVLYREPVEPDEDELEKLALHRAQSFALFGLQLALLEQVTDVPNYLRAVHDLVLSANSTARRIAAAEFASVPYCLNAKCDGCLYNEFCMKSCAEHDDLSLVPYLSATDKGLLMASGVSNVRQLAGLKDLVGEPARELVGVAAHADTVRQIAGLWSIGARLDELIHRAKKVIKSLKDKSAPALNYIPARGNSSLPVTSETQHPNLVMVYVDAQYDALHERLYLLGARVVAHRGGKPLAERNIVELTSGPPVSATIEQSLFSAWSRKLLEAVCSLAVGDGSQNPTQKLAPIHFVFFNRAEQTVLLEGLARNFQPVLQASPPLYDFLTDIAAFDSPMATFLDEEIRTFKNYPMLCQSLQSIARFLKFDWKTPLDFTQLFKAKLFDYIGKMDIDGMPEFYTRRARFGSSLPLEYAYAAWGQLPAPEKHDPFTPYRHVTMSDLVAFQARRLEAIECITHDIQGNKFTTKTSFKLPDLATYSTVARELSGALSEFTQIERFVELNDWKTLRHIPATRRALLGETLIVEYVEADQTPEVAEANRENQRRKALYEKWKREHQARFGDQKMELDDEQKEATKFLETAFRVQLRISHQCLDCDLHESLLLSNLRAGEMMVLFPTVMVDDRLPVAEQVEFTPTAKQMLYGPRVKFHRFAQAQKDEQGRTISICVDVEFKNGFATESMKPFHFGGSYRPLETGKLYTLDADPNNIYGYWQSRVVAGLCDGERTTLYDLLVSPKHPANLSGAPGQTRFLAGLQAFEKAGLFHPLEESKAEYIAGHATTPVLVVQGPPGTGKSYSTAFAVFARIQALMQISQPCRVFVSCKTHAATDVLLDNIREVQKLLRSFHDQNPKLFGQYFETRLLEVPLYRLGPKSEPAAGISKIDDENGTPAKNGKLIQSSAYVVIGATPGKIYKLCNKPKKLFHNRIADLLILDEASQMNLPESITASLVMKPEARLIVVGDHRQMPPIVKHDWSQEKRRTFQQYAVYESLFDTLRKQNPPMIRFAESFRLHTTMAAFLRQEVYRHDGIEYHSRATKTLLPLSHTDAFVQAVLDPQHALVVVLHDECGSQVRNDTEMRILTPILAALADPAQYGLAAEHGLGVVVPHRAQRAAMQEAFPQLAIRDALTGESLGSAIDTVERFQGGERQVILVSATESDRGYLLASSAFLLDPRRLTVAISRAKQKMILVASRSIFSLFSPDDETFANLQLWKNLLAEACPTAAWQGEREATRVEVWGSGKKT
jgi:AAA domain/PD-(D/E)XK nuclease superfamily